MKKILVILGFVVAAVALEGVAFYFSSRNSDDGETPEEKAAIAANTPSTFRDMMNTAEFCLGERNFEGAYGFIRLALDEAETRGESAEAGYQMGHLQYGDYRRGGVAKLESASLYLQAAYDYADDPALREKIGMTLLDVLESRGESGQFESYLSEMLSSVTKPSAKVDLWRRQFEFLLRSPDGWKEMNEALAKVENSPLHSREWVQLIEEMNLRSQEKVLANDEWYTEYVQTLDLTDPMMHRNELFVEVRSKLELLASNPDPSIREEALLRLAKAYVFMEDYEAGHNYLTRFIDLDPSEHLTDALVLLSLVSRERGEVENAAQLAESLILRFDFNAHTLAEIQQVVVLLEEHGFYRDALGLLDGCFSYSNSLEKEYANLVGRAAVIEERVGNHSNALGYMDQLWEMDDGHVFESTVSEMIELNMEQSNYAVVERWVNGTLSRLPEDSNAYENALFSLFEAKFWLDRPVLEQLFVGAAAIQTAPEDPRTASVELRMARYIENMQLHDLAISYYNRVGLLNFFQSDDVPGASSLNIGEEAMLGKVRCLQKKEDWVAADKLYRDLCNRTLSPLVKSAAAVGWGGLALHFGQNKEAERRYNLAHVQMLPEADQVRYLLGRAQIKAGSELRDLAAMEQDLELLAKLPEIERRTASIDFFNETFDYLYQSEDERAMLRIIDLAYQSEFAQWLPLQSYLLRLYEDRFNRKKISGLGSLLSEKDEVVGATMVELSQLVGQLEDLNGKVDGYRKKVAQ